MEREDVGASGELDDDGVFSAIGVVVFGELYAETASLDPDHGVQLRIEVGGSTEDLGRNLILLDGRAGMIEGVLSKITQEFAELF